MLRHGIEHTYSMRIAIAGAGVSGLTVAHALHPEHDITVFEANAYPGGHTNTVRVEREDGTWDVDTGFIVCNDRNYPTFDRLMAALGVPTQPTEMSFSVSTEDGELEYAGTPRGLFAQRENLLRPWFLRMLLEYRRFNAEARRLLASEDTTTSLGDFLQARRFSRPFIDRLLVPQASAVWSADPRQMWSFPARFLCEFFANHGMLSLTNRPQWSTVIGGSKRYVEKLTEPFAGRIRLGTPVERIARDPEGVTLTPRGGEAERFDEVVIAAHADEALAMLADPTDAERELLAAVPYARNEAVLHTDRSLLPRRRATWSSWNFHLLEEPIAKSTVTYHMNTLQRLDAPVEFCVTLNLSEWIDPARIIRTIPYAHPVFTPAGVAAQARHAEISGVNRTHYCGAWWGSGFHEDGVVSGARVAERFGVKL